MKGHIGPAVAQSNRNIRKLLRLTHASRKDVFYDLGCGYGQLCIIAVKEFDVRSSVGIESHKRRLKEARRRIKRLGLSHRIRIIDKDIYDADLSKATIVYNGLMENENDLKFYEENLNEGCRLVALSLPIVGVMPDAQDFPFYMMKKPFRKTASLSKWIQAVLTKQAIPQEFLEEVRTDPDYRAYIGSLKKLINQRFGTWAREPP